jgi:hypothetical protein
LPDTREFSFVWPSDRTSILKGIGPDGKTPGRGHVLF